MQRYLTLGALVFIAAIAYGTLGRVGLPYAIYFKLAPWLGHPNIRTYATIEHLLIFAIFGALLSLAFPDRILPVCCTILFLAPFFEYLQTLTSDRHGTMRDACEKIAGGLLGAIAAYAIIRWYRSVTDSKDQL
jgi:apolipoprotein N-acyltransferase